MAAKAGILCISNWCKYNNTWSASSFLVMKLNMNIKLPSSWIKNALEWTFLPIVCHNYEIDVTFDGKPMITYYPVCITVIQCKIIVVNIQYQRLHETKSKHWVKEFSSV